MTSPLLGLIVFAALTGPALADWAPTQRLTDNPSESWTAFCNAWCVAITPGPVIHTVWCDARAGNFEIYYKRSIDNGLSWSPDTRLTTAAGSSIYPSITASGNALHVVWNEDRDGNAEIYYKQSLDGGANWSEDIRLTEETNPSHTPTVCATGSNVHVAYQLAYGSNTEIFYLRSLNEGATWGAPLRLTTNAAHSDIPTIAVSGEHVHVAWYDTRQGNDEIFYKRSDDNGDTWTADLNISVNSSDYSRWPSLVVSGDDVHVVWERWFYTYNIFYRHSTDGGVTWESVVNLSNNSGDSWYASAACLGYGVHVVWMDTVHGNKEIYYRNNLPEAAALDERVPSAQPIQMRAGPNPFGGMLEINWAVPASEEGRVQLRIFDLSGRLIHQDERDAGRGAGRFVWHPKDAPGQDLPGGIYWIRLSLDEYSVSQPVLRVK